MCSVSEVLSNSVQTRSLYQSQVPDGYESCTKEWKLQLFHLITSSDFLNINLKSKIILWKVAFTHFTHQNNQTKFWWKCKSKLVVCYLTTLSRPYSFDNRMKVTGETKVLKENLPHFHFVNHKSHTAWQGINPGCHTKKLMTNHLRYVAAWWKSRGFSKLVEKYPPL
jgi:hypothetical protein